MDDQDYSVTNDIDWGEALDDEAEHAARNRLRSETNIDDPSEEMSDVVEGKPNSAQQDTPQDTPQDIGQDEAQGAAQNSSLNPKKRGLGRGLDALFGDDGDAEELESQIMSDQDKSAQHLTRKQVGLDEIYPNAGQPRQYFDDQSIDELAKSIDRYGLLQPILVRPNPDTAKGGYEIIAGERRWQACQIAQIHEVPIIIHDTQDDYTFELALIENIQREDLTPIDEAISYQKLIDRTGKTQKEIADMLGKSRPHIANILRLLTLPAPLQELVNERQLSMGHARALIGADNAEKIAERIIAEGLSVRQVESIVAQQKKPLLDGAADVSQNHSKNRAGQKIVDQSSNTDNPNMSSAGNFLPKDVNTLALEEEMSNMLGMAVDIQMIAADPAVNKGRVTIDFEDLDQLDQLLHRLSHG